MKGFSFPNLYAGFAWSENALTTFLALENSRSSLNARQREAIHLVVSQVNDCRYCIIAHPQIARINGFTEEEIKEIQLGTAGFDDDGMLNDFYLAGLTKENLVDLVLVIGHTIIANYLQALIRVPVDFPLTSDWEDPLSNREG